MMNSNANSFIGFLLSIECKNTFYQGVVNSIDLDRGAVFLKNCFQNGLSCGDKLIEIKITQIDNIEILADPVNAMSLLKPVVNGNSHFVAASTAAAQTTTDVNRPSVRGELTNSTSTSRVSNSNSDESEFRYSRSVVGNEANFNNRRKNQHKYRNTNESNGHSDTNNNYMFHHNQHHNHHHNQNNDNNHFETGSVNSLEDEFDFEKNLALFDKNAFYEEMGVVRSNDETAASAAVTTSASCGNFKAAVAAAAGSVSSSNEISPKTSSSFHNIANNFTSNKNYRFDEMILDTGEPINFQQIQVPTSKHSANKRYVTDEGFVIPCIDLELRRKLFEEAQKNGLCKQRQVECMGKCCTEMALQLVGGSIRFSVKNSHQKPSFLVLVNCNSIQGVYALCTARLLANKSAKIFVLLYNANLKTSVLSDFMNEMGEITFEDRNLFINELNLFCSVDSSNYKILKSLDELRELKSIDLIISGLEMQIQTQNSTLVFRNLTRFIENSKASVLTIDPTVEDNSSSSMCSIPSKWSITPVLPLAFPESCGRVYLCDFGFTKKMFQSVNIKYESPFGSKFLIPLHND